MKSQELYRTLREGLGAWFKQQGFKRAKAQLGWQSEPVLVWFQCDKWGWDRWAGSSFFVNFQNSGPPKPWGGPTQRLQEFLTTAELEEALSLQNRVISKLTPPPPEHIEMLRAAFAKTSPNSGLLIESLLSYFEPVERPYRPNEDFSLRYHDDEDVSAWSAFLLRVLPGIVEKLRAA